MAQPGRRVPMARPGRYPRTPVLITYRGHAVDNRPAMVDATVHNPSDSVDEWLPSVEDPLQSVEDVTTISSVHSNRPTTTYCGFGLDWPDREA